MVNVIAFVDFCGDFIRFSAKYLWNSLTDRTIWIWKFGRQQSWHHVKSNARHTKNPLKMLRFIVLFQSLNWIEWQTLCHQNSVCQVVFFCNCCEYNNKYHVKDVHEIAKSNEHRMAKALLLRKQKNLRIEKYRHTIIVYIVLLSSCFYSVIYVFIVNYTFMRLQTVTNVLVARVNHSTWERESVVWYNRHKKHLWWDWWIRVRE